MKTRKRLLAMVPAMAMVFALVACSGDTGGTSDPGADPGESSSAAGGTGEVYVVGICQQATHDALDAATQGFKDALIAEFGEDGVRFEEGNAGNEFANCGTIVDGFLAEGVDLILANATYPLQAAASATSDIPILGTSVTNYETALGTVGDNVSGTSDLAPLDEQAAMIQELFPDAENVGLLYCSGEPNSVYQVTTIQGYLEEMGYTCTQYAFTDANDLPSVTQTACDGSDVIYIPTDNTAANNTEVIANVVLPAGVPVVAGESGICAGCGVATLSISYYELGQITGEMAVQILTGQADISEMEIQYASVTKMYNAANCETLNLTMPEDYQPIE